LSGKIGGPFLAPQRGGRSFNGQPQRIEVVKNDPRPEKEPSHREVTGTLGKHANRFGSGFAVKKGNVRFRGDAEFADLKKTPCDGTKRQKVAKALRKHPETSRILSSSTAVVENVPAWQWGLIIEKAASLGFLHQQNPLKKRGKNAVGKYAQIGFRVWVGEKRGGEEKILMIYPPSSRQVDKHGTGVGALKSKGEA